MHHQTTPVRRAARAAVGLALLPALVVAGAAPAAAHDELIRTAPAVDETVTTAPSEVLLTFSGDLIDGEGIQNLLQVRDADGNQWQSAAGTVDGPIFSAPLCEGLPNGDYEVAYRVVYSDGHSEERSFDFAVDDPAAPAAGTAPQGCGTAVAGASPETTAGQGDAASAAATAQADASDAAQPADSDALPAWVWAAGIAGLAVLVVAFLLMGRRARALGHLDDGR
ncbi:copper resistance protein CopC [Micrococcus luteus]|uniref:copper resistance CopC family protein n=1 Tax=Micrococcus TaxID=1269 RepID=UPI00162ADBA8|nr:MULTISPECIES: copper resistance CopC family protein [Micrococcus]MCV7647003.1 copper resistance protein CopC [Micrococcus luteus]QTP18121.1 copper resistance protein CopC [Micrococcus luteus]WAC17249.1 copper resistance protein CopC [Micrococcus sp. SL257]